MGLFKNLGIGTAIATAALMAGCDQQEQQTANTKPARPLMVSVDAFPYQVQSGDTLSDFVAAEGIDPYQPQDLATYAANTRNIAMETGTSDGWLYPRQEFPFNTQYRMDSSDSPIVKSESTVYGVNLPREGKIVYLPDVNGDGKVAGQFVDSIPQRPALKFQYNHLE